MKVNRTILEKSEKIVRIFEKITAGISAAIVYAMMAIVIYGIVRRYVLNSPVSWVAEITEFMVVALTYLTLAHIQDRKGHVRIEFLVIRLSQKTQLVLGIITSLCALAIFVLSTLSGFAYAFKALKFGFRTTESDFHLFTPRLLVSIGCFLMCLRLLIDIGSQAFSLLNQRAEGRKGAGSEGVQQKLNTTLEKR